MIRIYHDDNIFDIINKINDELYYKLKGYQLIVNQDEVDEVIVFDIIHDKYDSPVLL